MRRAGCGAAAGSVYFPIRPGQTGRCRRFAGAQHAEERDVYAIFEDGGKQYKVSQGDNLLIELQDVPEGRDEITFDKVLMVGEGEGAKIGAPWVSGASVTAKVLEALKTDKVIGIKFRRRKGYKKKWGHRQNMLKVQIASINA